MASMTAIWSKKSNCATVVIFSPLPANWPQTFVHPCKPHNKIEAYLPYMTSNHILINLQVILYCSILLHFSLSVSFLTVLFATLC
jgi:hypothetical protein